MSQLHHSSSVWQGTAAGTAFSVLAWIQVEELVKTIILSIVGLLVSFILSLILEKIRRGKGGRRRPK